MAKGARRPKSLFLAGTQFLCFGEYLLYKGNGMYHINSVETIEVFYNIRTDLDKLTYATYITKIVNDVTTENQNSYNIMQIYLNTLHIIAEGQKSLELIVSTFRLRLLSIIGCKPIINACASCNSKESIKFFSIKDNGFKCEMCGKQDKGAVEISDTTKDAIRYIILADSKKLFSFNVSQESEKELEIISKIYLTEKLEKEYKLN